MDSTRARHRRSTWLVGGLVAAFLVIALGPALAGRGVLLDVDNQARRYPVKTAGEPVTTDAIVCRGDTVEYFPEFRLAGQGLRSGHYPAWSQYEVGGSPLIGVPNGAVLSPFSLPYLVLPLWLAPAFVAVGTFLVAIGGMFLFLRRLGASRAAALLAGVVFTSSGFMLMWTNWPHIKVAALIPALFWAVERIAQRRRPADAALLAALVACMVLGGFPAVTLYALVLAGLYLVVRAVRDRSWREGLGVLGLAGIGVLLGAALASFQLVPFIADLGALGLAERDFASMHQPVSALITTLAPDAFGVCAGGTSWGPVIPIENIGYVGAAALVLAVVCLLLSNGRERPRNTAVGYFGVVAIALVVLIWFGGPLLDAVQSLPLFRSNRIGRAQSVFGFVVAVLAALGFDRLMERSDGIRASRTRWVIGGAFVVLLLGVGWYVWREARQDVVAEKLPLLQSALTWPLVALALAVVCVVLAVTGPARLRQAALAVLAVTLVAQSALFAHQVLPLSKRDNFYPTTQTHRFLQRHLGHDRYDAAGAMYPALSDWYRIRAATGHQFTSTAWKDLLATVDPEVQRSTTYSEFSGPLPLERVGDSHVLDRLAVRYWVSPPAPGRPIPSRATLVADGLRVAYADPHATVYERVNALPRIRWASSAEVVPSPEERVARLVAEVPDDTVLLEEGTASSGSGGAEVTPVVDHGGSIVVDVDARAAGHLVVADSIHRNGWTVRVDGEPADLVAADHAFAAVMVPAGRHRIDFSYAVPGLAPGIALSVLGLVGCAVLLVVDLLRRTRRRSAAEPDRG